jgi:hypothetical protein
MSDAGDPIQIDRNQRWRVPKSWDVRVSADRKFRSDARRAPSSIACDRRLGGVVGGEVVGWMQALPKVDIWGTKRLQTLRKAAETVT